MAGPGRSAGRAVAGAVLRGALVSLAGMLGALVLVLLAAVVLPDVALSTGFFWVSAGAAVVLQFVLGFAGTGAAVRYLAGRGMRGPSFAAVAATGPLLVAVLVQLGALAEGEPLAAWPPLLAAAAGAAAGARRAVRAGAAAGA
ncbi:hypothetical protein [Spirillospora sp. NPDC029432]|uniref:hypothetical protein n=1 Tax=Spirillospora sp. NPDC029432 TaxID=3154599 RepID=UPI003452E570